MSQRQQYDPRKFAKAIQNYKGMPKMGGILGTSLGLVAATVGGLLLSIPACLFNVEAGHNALVFNKFTGLKDKIYVPGTHIRIPMIEKVIDYEIRPKPTVISSLTGSKDLQMVDVTVRVLTKPKEDKLLKLYRTLSTDYDERVLPGIVNEILKSVIAQFTAAQLIIRREDVSRMIERSLTKRADDFNIAIENVAITDLQFGKEYAAAVEAKQVAQQDAERSKFVVEKAQQEKRSIIVRAQGEAESALLISFFNVIYSFPAIFFSRFLLYSLTQLAFTSVRL
jgi:prohibitin 2